MPFPPVHEHTCIMAGHICQCVLNALLGREFSVYTAMHKALTWCQCQGHCLSAGKQGDKNARALQPGSSDTATHTEGTVSQAQLLRQCAYLGQHRFSMAVPCDSLSMMGPAEQTCGLSRPSVCSIWRTLASMRCRRSLVLRPLPASGLQGRQDCEHAQWTRRRQDTKHLCKCHNMWWLSLWPPMVQTTVAHILRIQSM